MRVAIAGDHAGFEYKQNLVNELKKSEHEILDLGPSSEESVDYPDYAQAVAEALRDRRVDRGILVCGSAVGMAVAANKFPGVRAGVCHDTYSAHQGVEHDDINVLCMGQRIIGIELAKEIVTAFLGAKFIGQGKYLRRLDKVKAIESRYMRDGAK
jgi:ribose 5-phosphate isomerase B